MVQREEETRGRERETEQKRGKREREKERKKEGRKEGRKEKCVCVNSVCVFVCRSRGKGGKEGRRDEDE